MTFDESQLISTLAKILFTFYKDMRTKEGYHLPERCPVYERDSDNEDIQNNADIIHCNKCDATLGEFEDLDEFMQDDYLKQAEKYYKKFKN